MRAGVFAPWRGLVVAGVCTATAALAISIEGLEAFALWAPVGAFAVFAIGSTAMRVRWVSIGVLTRTSVMLVRERGLWRLEEREVEVSSEAALRVEVARDESWLGQLPMPALRKSAIVVAGALGDAPITSALPGMTRQRAIAARLTELLGLPAPTGDDDALPPHGWPNVRVYTGFAVVFTLLAMGQVAIEGVNRGRTGRFELICVERCLYDGMECLPGGRIAGRYAPGDRVVQVADPGAPTGLRALRVPVVLGHVTVFECRAGAAQPTPVPEP